MIINNVIGLAKAAKIFNVLKILSSVIEERGGHIIEHGGASSVALAREMQLLAGRTKLGLTS